MKAIVNTDIVTENHIIENGVILFNNDRITAVGAASDMVVPEKCEIIDAEGCYTGPGFVDIHCHGGGRYTAWENPAAAGEFHLHHGTTSLTLSLAYNLSLDTTLSGIDAIKKAMNPAGPGNINGIFFEGPFSNPHYGSSSEGSRPVSREEYELLYKRAGDSIRQWMYSPELENGDGFARFVTSKGIPLAIGHTCASPAIIERAVGFGATICSHLFDAMGCHLGDDSIKYTGIIQDTAADAALITDELYLEIICDSRAIHVKPTNLKVAYTCGGADRVILITDHAVYPHNPSDYPEDDIHSAIDINFNEEGEISGSKLTMDQALKNMNHYTHAPPVDLFKMASINPAKAIGIYNTVGSVEKNKLANFALLDKNLDLRKVFQKGEQIC